MSELQTFLQNNVLAEYALRLVLSVICGFCLGIERKIRRQTVGIRTLILISVSSCLLSILSIYVSGKGKFSGDPGRIAAAVVTGIGFIGGGAILKQGLNIRGLTTAAIIFASSAIGLSCGAGLYFPALLTLLICLLMLVFMEKLEHKLFPAGKTKIIHLKFDETTADEKDIGSILQENGIIHLSTDVLCSTKKNQIELIYTVKIPDKLDSVKVVNELKNIDSLVSVAISDD